MVVLVIIAFLASMALVAIDPNKKSKTARGFAESLSQRLEMTRQRAIATQSVQRISLTADGIIHTQAPQQGMLADYQIEDIDDAASWQDIGFLSAPNGVDIASFDIATHLVDGVSVPSVGDNLPTTLYFRPDGSVYSQETGFAGGTIFVADEAQQELWRVVMYRITGTLEVYRGW